MQRSLFVLRTFVALTRSSINCPLISQYVMFECCKLSAMVSIVRHNKLAYFIIGTHLFTGMFHLLQPVVTCMCHNVCMFLYQF